MIDFHSHLIPGVDDGAATLAEALAGVAEMRRDGITRIVATPHLSVSLLRRPAAFEAYMARMDAAWAALLAAATQRFPEMALARGVELALDSLPPKLTDLRLFLGDSRAMLVEFPHLHVPVNSETVLRTLIANGALPVLAHPERYGNLGADFELVRSWKALGATTQVNAGSLTGRYGEGPRQQAEALIANGLADCMASDYHARGVCAMGSAVRLLSSRGMEQQARALTETNPALLLAGQTPGAVLPPTARADASRKSFLRRVLGR